MSPPAGRSIDLNADLGESFGRWTLGDDAALLPLITSANVACGFHAGDPLTLHRTVTETVAHGVVIGAQVSYPDLVGFGRRFLDMAADELTAAVLYQLGALNGLARTAGAGVRYLKPHGALYNACVDHEEQAAAVVAAVVAYDPSLPVLGLPGSALLRTAVERGVRAVPEYFVDRRYTDDGRLVDRRRPDAMISDPLEAAERAVAAARDGQVSSMCTHGDSPGAVAMAAAVRAALLAAGFTLAPFAGPTSAEGPPAVLPVPGPPPPAASEPKP